MENMAATNYQVENPWSSLLLKRFSLIRFLFLVSRFGSTSLSAIRRRGRTGDTAIRRTAQPDVAKAMSGRQASPYQSCGRT
jgi:hypothetical protein